jgi:hypothetical protein
MSYQSDRLAQIDLLTNFFFFFNYVLFVLIHFKSYRNNFIPIKKRRKKFSPLYI